MKELALSYTAGKWQSGCGLWLPSKGQALVSPQSCLYSYSIGYVIHSVGIQHRCPCTVNDFFVLHVSPLPRQYKWKMLEGHAMQGSLQRLSTSFWVRGRFPVAAGAQENVLGITGKADNPPGAFPPSNTCLLQKSSRLKIIFLQVQIILTSQLSPSLSLSSHSR